MARPSQACFPQTAQKARVQTPRVSARVEAQPASEAGPGHQLAEAVGERVVMRSCSFERIGTGRGNPVCAVDADRLEWGGSVAADEQGMIGRSPASPSSQPCRRGEALVPETLPRLPQTEWAPAVWAVQHGWPRRLVTHRTAGRRSWRSSSSSWNAILGRLSLAGGTLGGGRAATRRHAVELEDFQGRRC